MYLSFFIGLTTLTMIFIFSTRVFAQVSEGAKSLFRLEALFASLSSLLKTVNYKRCGFS